MADNPSTESSDSPSIHEALRFVQLELKAPKGQWNDFGKYNFRNAEDILEAVKPVCGANGLTLVEDDEIVLIGDRYYVKATATVYNDRGESISAKAFAREEEAKKGMDSAQITGSTSSYARKYALNGLFAIDDSKDADANEHSQAPKGRTSSTTNTTSPTSPPKASSAASEKQLGLLASLARKAGYDQEWIDNTTDKVRSSSKATSAAIDKIQDKINETAPPTEREYR